MKNANPVSCYGATLLAIALALAACAKQPESVPATPKLAGSATEPAPIRYTYEVVRSWPHDPRAFTQGLVFRNGELLESTGLNGESSLREVDIKTGRPLKQITVPQQYFAEGLAVLGSHAYQLTWQNHKGFIYDVDTFRQEAEFAYTGEGWGLATDGKELILSDGTNKIRFLDPKTFEVTHSIDVTYNGRPVVRLNELEWIKGEIFANVWQTDVIERIDPATGHVVGEIDFSGLLAPQDHGPETDVLNGIAYDPVGDRLFITGKKWSKMFEVRLKVKP